MSRLTGIAKLFGRADDVARATKRVASSVLRRGPKQTKNVDEIVSTIKAPGTKIQRTTSRSKPRTIGSRTSTIGSKKPFFTPKRVALGTLLGAGVGGLYMLNRGGGANLPPQLTPEQLVTVPRSKQKTYTDMVNEMYQTPGMGSSGGGQSTEDILRELFQNPVFGQQIPMGPSTESILGEAFRNPLFNQGPSVPDYISPIEKQNAEAKANLEAYLTGIRGYGKNTAGAIANAYNAFSKGTADLGEQEYTRAQDVAANIDQLYRELGFDLAQGAAAPVGEVTAVTGLTPVSGQAATAQQVIPAYGAGIADYMGQQGLISRESLGQLALSQAEQGAGLSASLLNQVELSAARQQIEQALAANERLAQARMQQAGINADLENAERDRRRGMITELAGAKIQDAAIARELAMLNRSENRDILSQLANARISDRDYGRDEARRRDDRLFEAGLADREETQKRDAVRDAALSKARSTYLFNVGARTAINRVFGSQGAWEAFIRENPDSIDLVLGQLGLGRA